MENTLNQIEPLVEKIEDFGKTTLELYKLKLIRNTAEIISTFVSRGAVVVSVSMFLVFASIGLALWIGDVLGKPYLGFLCVAGLYIMLGGVLFYLLHPFIMRKVSNSIISKVFSN